MDVAVLVTVVILVAVGAGVMLFRRSSSRGAAGKTTPTRGSSAGSGTGRDLSGVPGRCPECARPSKSAVLTLVCPSCGYGMAEYNESFLVQRVVADGEWSAPCDGCDRESFVFGPESACARCGRLRPGVNDQLAQRFAALERRAAAREDFCPGCHEAGKTTPIEIDIDKSRGAVVQCSGCSSSFRIPASVWCPNCGLNIRHSDIAALVAQENRG